MRKRLAAIPSVEQHDALVDREVASLRRSNARWNEFFRAVFVAISVALGMGRMAMMVYAWFWPYTWSHHVEARGMFGDVHWMEFGSVISLGLCGVYHLRPLGWLLLASAGSAVMVALIQFVILFNSELHGWFWERGWWYLLYFPGFSLFYTAITFYASVVMRDITIEQGIEELSRLTTIQIV